jgi:hypothetical protein
VPVCVGESITIPYTASGTFTGGNVFTAQLSDEFGCFSNPVDIGSVTSTTSGSIEADVPLSTIAGTGYRVRVVAANPLIYGVPNNSPFTVHAVPTVTASATESVLCEGQSTVLTGGGASSYVWDNSAINGQGISPSATTTYTVIGTDANGCENSASVQVTVNPLPTVTAQATETVLCAGESTELTGSGAVSYVWDNGAMNGQAIVPTQSTTYTVVGTDGNSCENTATVDITVNALPTVTANASETVLCGGGSTVLTGNGAVSYAWDNDVTDGETITPTQSTSYTVIGTDGNGCENSASVSVTVNALPTVTASASETTLCEGASTVLSGSGVLSYVWENGAVNGEAITPSESTTFTVTGTDGNGCVNSASVDVTVNALPNVTANATETLFCQGGSTVLSGSGALTYAWDNGAMDGQTITPSESTTYTVTGTDGNGCENTASVVVTVNPLPVATITASGPVSFCEGNSVTLSAGGGVTYLWSTGASTSDILVAEQGDFDVTVTDGNGCQATSAVTSVTILEIPVADVSFSGPISFCEGGSVTLTAAAGSGYQWNSGVQTQAVTVTQSGTFSVTLTDVNGCTAVSEEVEVTVFPAATVEVIASGETTFCQGGQVTLTATDAENFIWSDGQDTQTITASASGSFIVTVTDANGCTATSEAVTVTVTPLPAANITASGLLVCPGEEVTLTASGAMGQQYQWSNGASTQSINVDQGGSYTVTVTDVNGCSATSEAVQITQGTGAQAELFVSGDLEFCFGGSVTLSVIPEGEFTGFLWSNGSTASSITVNASGEYSVTVSGEGSCFGETQELGPVTVNVLSELPVVEQTDDVLTVVNGPFASYQWFRNGSPIPGAAASSYQFTVSGNYYVRVTGQGGCVTQSMNFEVTVSVSVEELSASKVVRVFPNPTDGVLNVELSGFPANKAKFSVRDLAGRLHLQGLLEPMAQSPRFSIDVAALPAGAYLLEIDSIDERTTIWFVRW